MTKIQIFKIVLTFQFVLTASISTNIAVGTWNVRTLRPAGKLDSCNEQVSLGHGGALRNALEKLW